MCAKKKDKKKEFWAKNWKKSKEFCLIRSILNEEDEEK